MPTVDKRSFLKLHKGRGVDVGKLEKTPAAVKALEAAGVSLAKAAKAAGGDGVLGAEEAYGLLEGLRGAARTRAAEALGRLLDDARLEGPRRSPIDRQGSVFGAMLAGTTARRAPVDVSAVDVSAVDVSAVYVSASTVEGLLGSSALGPLGSYGPLGAYGPLGELGPVGGSAWHASTWIDNAYKTWGSGWDGGIDTQGPLSEAGPLGERGPLGEAYVGTAGSTGFLDENDALRQLKGLGQQAVLGPLGPLGPLGALGPLGPVGAHGLGSDESGSFLDANGSVRRTIDVWYDDAHTTRNTFELYERYTEAFAKSMVDNDTSFMVEGRVEGRAGDRETDSFTFTSSSDQLVTIAVVPEKQLDDFDFEITDGKGKVLAQSDSSHLVDWAQLEVKEGTTLKVRVKLKASAHWLSKDYRLFVTGSGPRAAALPRAPRDGAHVQAQGTR